ncbi:hypothetical protein GH983_22075 (plasmid) [Agrobacterium sp. MA01]|uniref:hypothetical protein n=1 Tax=Agrobacterium sp. MA01 TaxID=2664893 RepID=UPI00129BADFB|nr:hypothetical protein [Agrobacterium sp. MA01]QGG93245.1 hypothetical protein GH983_22075 [Agrobacterium sp. MA01]
MRKIEIIEDVRIRFPGRDEEFNLGVEVGALSVLLAQGNPVLEREISVQALDQLKPIADRFRYSLSVAEVSGEMVHVRLERYRRRPQLRVV